MTQRLLVIEDEPTLSRLLSYNLTNEGYEVIVEDHGQTGYETALRQDFDLILLDLMLPGMNGFEIMTKLRSEGVKTPVIILTAKNAEEEVVQGLKSGADDYITKPFGVAELLARVAAVLRRSTGQEEREQPAKQDTSHIVLGPLAIYPEKYEVTLNGEPITLRPKEFEVLLYLARKPGVVMTRDDLMNAVWGFDYIGGQRTVDVHVSSLRKKLELDPQSVHIDSIRGVGYKLVVNKKQASIM
ncbi:MULTISPECIES: response regulator transcription factor [Paenibacillus]|jgi:two-component system alkaline phosphatase synthesis response regulator PhoP|uniref:Two-component system, OmpR family, alkaline phosphatase synthesis response regulator PhoP n=2 Tax=Paenibacillus barengoltzii TaxID=343517 RepID=R9LC75_9BACL|nr:MULTISPECIES: response regulator transcription factor [Paenibacillus]EOS56295.1 two-component system, OmpR family, alkaline phosphatase synthesis response regulator PhoP [Paenibacillus barengoltzii G22]MDU0331119.1 response regulator transcription factor [Paenibacillus sp. 3LSP]MEC2344810.1 response regulator transcription factor [Paenibacillus barengoltzii]SMF39676.1 two-component system, OmpR family, alkaline phosphatase synthesis response regulator PhoP [Paenibacillus barengoltzii J12]SM